MQPDFHGNFWVNVTWFFAFFSGLLAWTESIHAHSGMDGKATPAHDLNHAPCISFAGAQELFQQFLQNSLICCLL